MDREIDQWLYIENPEINLTHGKLDFRQIGIANQWGKGWAFQ